MDNQFVPKEFEKILISLGFDYTQRVHLIFKEKKYYGILWQQVFDFFREKYEYSGEVYYYSDTDFNKWHFDVEPLTLAGDRFTTPMKSAYETYEEARLECLKKLIEIIKNK